MLESLLNSKLKKKLLSIFFSHPKRSFSAFELGKMAEASPLLVSRALREFHRALLLENASRKQVRYFRVNPRFLLYDELKDLVSEEGHLPEDLVGQKLKKIPNLKFIVLSGIFTLEPKLPVDLLLVGDGVSRLVVQKVLGEIENMVGQEVNYAVIAVAEYEHRRFLRDRLIRDILDYPHIVVVDGLKKD